MRTDENRQKKEVNECKRTIAITIATFAFLVILFLSLAVLRNVT
jgi:hypothetical protein